jgi:hypothetical protein
MPEPLHHAGKEKHLHRADGDLKSKIYRERSLGKTKKINQITLD